MISNRIKSAYIEYATEVNIHRALPLVYDGLKTVQRRLLINGARICHSSLVKSASIIGETMANNHPHSDLSLYGTLVNLVNDFYPMFIGQGNWGGFKTPCAAARYTSVRLSDFSTNTYLPYIRYSSMVENDLGHLENSYIPTLIPYALVNGTSGIGTGVSTLIPAFTKRSVLSYVKWLLSPNGKSAPQLKLEWPNCEVENSVIDNGRGRVKYNIVYESAHADGNDIFIVKGNPPYCDIENMLHKEFSSEIDSNKVFIRNESGKGQVRYVVGKIKWINSENIETKIKGLNRVVGVNMNWSMGYNSKPISRLLSPHQVLEECVKKYTKAVDDWKVDKISKVNLDINFQNNKDKVLQLLSQGKSWSDIKTDLSMTEEQINFIKSKSVNQLQSDKSILPSLNQQILDIQNTQYV